MDFFQEICPPHTRLWCESRSMNFRKLLGRAEAGTKAWTETDSVRKIVEALDHMDPAKAGYVAAFAYMLGRVAYADQEISDQEVHVMESVVMGLGELPEDQAMLVVQIAKQRSQLFGATDNYLVAREFNRLADRDQKLNLLHCLFAVSAAHDDISIAEDSEIRQIASELGLDHREFVSVRLTFRDRLAALKKPDE